MKDLKISKELLREVLGIRTILMEPILEPENKVGYLVYGSQNTLQEVRNNHKQISIYEFAFKCKEWAFKYRYMIDSNVSPTLKEVNNGTVGTSLIYNLNNMESKRFQSDTELEAIFKACEWILKEQNNDVN